MHITKKTFTSFDLEQSKDVLKTICAHKKRPKLVIGFSAETENLLKNSKKKFQIKQCDWMIANKITKKYGFKSNKNKVFFIEKNNIEEWKVMTKKLIARKLVDPGMFESGGDNREKYGYKPKIKLLSKLEIATGFQIPNPEKMVIVFARKLKAS